MWEMRSCARASRGGGRVGSLRLSGLDSARLLIEKAS